MYPNQQPQYSVDYLNEISGPQPTSRLPKNFRLLAIVGIIMIILSFVIIVFGILNSKDEPTPTDLAVRLKTLETVSRDTQENLSSGDLRSLNTNLTLALSNSSREMNAFLGEKGANAIDKAAKENPDTARLTKTFTDADLNAVISRTYPREMAYELNVTLLLLKSLYDETENAKFKDYLSSTYDDLEPIYKQLSKFNQD